MATKEYLGISQDGHVLKIARIHKKKKQVVVTGLDRITIGQDKKLNRDKKRSEQLVNEYSEDYAFGINQHYSDEKKDIDELKMLAAGENGLNERESSNEVLLVSYLEEMKKRKIRIGTTIPAGITDFQVLKLKNYAKLKKKELNQVVREKLVDLYDHVPVSDRYVTHTRQDGSLILASYNEVPYTLDLVQRVRNLYSGKIRIEQLLPDEAILLALIKKNYPLTSGEITSVIQLGEEQSRIFFMQGKELLQVLPKIQVDSKSRDIMQVIFSKILFQLDTGELPNIDRFIVANNDLKEKSLDFLRDKFSNAKVNEFKFDENQVVLEDDIKSVAPFFTTAIGAAWAAMEAEDDSFSVYSMMPAHVLENQKVLKFKWHGWFVMALIVATPALFFLQYQQKQDQIRDLEFQSDMAEQQIQNLKPIADQVSQLDQMMAEERSKLSTLNRLNTEPYYWSTVLKTLNDGLGDMQNVWIMQLRTADDGYMLQGYTMTRSRAPRVANMFRGAELKAVSVEDIRGTKLYKFVIKVHKDFKHEVDATFSNLDKVS